jgi:hypothetical protein
MKDIQAKTIEEAIEKCNKERLNHKDEWIFLHVNINYQTFLIKQYNTWIQRFEKTTYTDGKIMQSVRSGPMDCKVRIYKKELEKMFKEFLGGI